MKTSAKLTYERDQEIEMLLRELGSMSGLANGVIANIGRARADEAKLYKELGWWSDHTQGFQTQAAKILMRLNRAVALTRAAELARYEESDG